MARVLIYSTPWCGHCFLARSLLKRRGIAFDEIDVSHDDERRARLIEETGHRTVPLVFIDGRFVGGNRELRALERAGGLSHLMP